MSLMPWEKFLSSTIRDFRSKFGKLESSQRTQIREKAVDDSLLEPCQIEVLDFGMRKKVIWIVIHDKLLPDMTFKIHENFKHTEDVEFADRLPIELRTLLKGSILIWESSTKPIGTSIFLKNRTFSISHGAPPQSLSDEFLRICKELKTKTQDTKPAFSDHIESNPEHQQQKPSFSKNIFIVHGTDHEPLKKLKQMLISLDFDPIILHEQASGSRTVIEKLEKYSDVGYAFVILTPDDIGASFKELFEKTARGSYENGALDAARRILAQSKGTIERFVEFNEKFMQDPVDASKFLQLLVPSARQNIILEFGYFMGRLGRQRVCCLYKGDIELPSDVRGIVTIPFDKTISEIKGKIVKELEEAGYKMEKSPRKVKYPLQKGAQVPQEIERKRAIEKNKKGVGVS